MAGIQRFVTYLYLYEQDQKLRGTGFAKIEIRGEQCRNYRRDIAGLSFYKRSGRAYCGGDRNDRIKEWYRRL